MFDRGEFYQFLQWLDGFYRAPEGLQRPTGLVFVDQNDAYATLVRPDLEGIAAWGFDTYLNGRTQGLQPDAAKQLVIRSIEATEEWRGKHPRPTNPGDGLGGNQQGFVTVAGKWFENGAGQPWVYRGCTDFRLFERFCNGEDIQAVLDQRVLIGANTLRVLLSMYQITRFYPHDRASYFEDLHSFVRLLGRRGLRAELVLFADAGQLPWAGDLAQQRQFAGDVDLAISDEWNVFQELVNEYQQNGIDPTQFEKPVGLASRGSGVADTPGGLPPWDYLTYHPARDSQWPRKMKNASELADEYGKPAISDEIMGAAVLPRPGSRDNNQANFFDAGAVSGLMADAGFHSDAGVQSEMMEDVQLGCAFAFFGGMGTIPVAARSWNYTRGGLPTCPVDHDDTLATRTYVRQNEREAWGIAVQPTTEWRLRLNRGLLDGQYGDRGNVFHLTF